MNEASGNLIDTINGRNTDSISGTPVFNQPGITYDGVTAAHNWPASVEIVDAASDYVLYIKLKVTNIMSSSNEFFFSTGSRDATKQGPYLNWLGSAKQWRVTNHFAGGSATATFAIGRELTVGETWVLVMSQTASTTTVEAAFHSDTGEKSSSTVVGSASAGWGVGDFYILGLDGAGAGAAPMQALELGAIKGTAKPKQDLIDTADILINGLPSTDTTIIPNMIPSKLITSNLIPSGLIKGRT